MKPIEDSIRKLMDKEEKVAAKRNALQAEIEQLEKEQEELDSALASAFEANDMKKYEELYGKKRELAVKISARKDFAKRFGKSYTDEDVVACWNEFMTGFLKDQAKQIETFEKHRRDLFKEMLSLLENKDKALCGKKQLYDMLDDHMIMLDNIPKLPISDCRAATTFFRANISTEESDRFVTLFLNSEG